MKLPILRSNRDGVVTVVLVSSWTASYERSKVRLLEHDEVCSASAPCSAFIRTESYVKLVGAIFRDTIVEALK